ncbi:alpha/beta hydrolase [Colwellia piezophila]|uniref:alpha/beta hydrolase n=1 Tax=Colwellia piezophila TaxID=211668 RepID=UPI00039A1D2A|nr:alpha/beta hydrolase [Colwellia piezophila]
MRLLVLIGLLLGAFTCWGKSSWQEQQARAEDISAQYQAKYPQVRSDRIVFKKVALPDGSELELDFRIVRPKTGGPFPVVFFVHGGAWGTGSKAQFTHESFELADNGIAGVRLEYRWKKHGAKYPQAISDVMDAIDFVRQRADEFNLDFNRVGLAGGSAGGHLSSIAAQLTPECISYDGFNGLFDAFERNGGRFGGGDYTGTTEAQKKSASAMYMIKDNPPDTLLYHGTADTTVVVKQAYRFSEAIRAKGGNADVLAYNGAGHAFFNKAPYQVVTTQALLDHTSFVFGLTNKKPVLSDYALPPKQANVSKKALVSKPVELPAGFQLIGKWLKQGSSAKVFEFKTNNIAISPAEVQLKWQVRDGNYMLFWKNGNGAKIEISDADKIKIGKTVYLKAQ